VPPVPVARWQFGAEAQQVTIFVLVYVQLCVQEDDPLVQPVHAPVTPYFKPHSLLLPPLLLSQVQLSGHEPKLLPPQSQAVQVFDVLM